MKQQTKNTPNVQMEEMAEVYFCTFFSFYFELSKICRKFAVSINLKMTLRMT